MKVASFLENSWRRKTNKTYDSAWNVFERWCTFKPIDPLEATVANLSEFFLDQFERGVGYTTLKGYRSSLSNVLTMVEGRPISEHAVIQRLFQSFENLRPSQPRYPEVWNVQTLLDYIVQIPAPWSQIDLSQVLCILLMLTLIARSDDLEKISLKSIKLDDGKFLAIPRELLKQTRRGKQNPSFEALAYEPDEKLDIVRLTQKYLEMTKTQRQDDDDHLFVSVKGDGKPVGTQTLARWAKHIMAKAGIDVSKYKAHSARSAAVKAALAQGEDVEDIIRHGRWLTNTTFEKHYARAASRGINPIRKESNSALQLLPQNSGISAQPSVC